jgi:hypothetical protein
VKLSTHLERTKTTKRVQFFIILFLFFSSMAYLPQAIQNNLIGGIAYVKFEYDQPFLNLDLRYFKDVIMVLMVFFFFIRDITTKKPISTLLVYYFSIMLILYGTIVMLIHYDTLNYLQIIAGIRSIIFIIFCIKIREFIDQKFAIQLVKLIYVLVAIELMVISIQYVVFARYYGFVNPFSLRLLGTFGGFSLAGYFALCCSTFVYIVSSKHHIRFTLLFYVLCFMVAGFSGTRTALVGCILVMSAAIFRFVLQRIKKQKQYYLVVSIMTLIPLITVVSIIFISKIADRGNMIQTQIENGRLSYILDFILNNPTSISLFGKGIGFGTNAAVNMAEMYRVDVDAQFMDGTFNTIITQYGLVMFSISLVVFSLIFIQLFMKGKKHILDAFLIMCIFLIMCLATNVFEQYFFFSLFCITLYTFMMLDRQNENINTLINSPISTSVSKKQTTHNRLYATASKSL